MSASLAADRLLEYLDATPPAQPWTDEETRTELCLVLGLPTELAPFLGFGSVHKDQKSKTLTTWLLFLPRSVASELVAPDKQGDCAHGAEAGVLLYRGATSGKRYFRELPLQNAEAHYEANSLIVHEDVVHGGGSAKTHTFTASKKGLKSWRNLLRDRNTERAIVFQLLIAEQAESRPPPNRKTSHLGGGSANPRPSEKFSRGGLPKERDHMQQNKRSTRAVIRQAFPSQIYRSPSTRRVATSRAGAAPATATKKTRGSITQRAKLSPRSYIFRKNASAKRRGGGPPSWGGGNLFASILGAAGGNSSTSDESSWLSSYTPELPFAQCLGLTNGKKKNSVARILLGEEEADDEASDDCAVGGVQRGGTKAFDKNPNGFGNRGRVSSSGRLVGGEEEERDNTFERLRQDIRLSFAQCCVSAILEYPSLRKGFQCDESLCGSNISKINR